MPSLVYQWFKLCIYITFLTICQFFAPCQGIWRSGDELHFLLETNEAHMHRRSIVHTVAATVTQTNGSFRSHETETARSRSCSKLGGRAVEEPAAYAYNPSQGSQTFPENSKMTSQMYHRSCNSGNVTQHTLYMRQVDDLNLIIKERAEQTLFVMQSKQCCTDLKHKSPQMPNTQV